MAARIAMIATTIISSIRVKPRCARIADLPGPVGRAGVFGGVAGCAVPDGPGEGGGGRRGEPLRPVTLTTRYQVQPVGRYFASRLGTVQVYWPVDVRVRVTTLPMTCGLPASVHLIVPVAEPATAIALQRVVVAARPMLACVLNVV